MSKTELNGCAVVSGLLEMEEGLGLGEPLVLAVEEVLLGLLLEPGLRPLQHLRVLLLLRGIRLG